MSPRGDGFAVLSWRVGNLESRLESLERKVGYILWALLTIAALLSPDAVTKVMLLLGRVQ
jgi:Sec-independent protein secretion pathway component TatC